MSSPLNKKLEHVKWGEFKLGDLFDIQKTSSFDSDELTDGDAYDYVTRTSNNQGILRKTGFVNQSNINKAGGWSLGLLQMDFFYRNRPWYAGQFVRHIVPKIQLTRSSILFFTTVLNKLKPKLLSVLVRHVNGVFINSKVKLPITANEKIDFEFIDTFMEELETERVAELRAYLTAANLRNLELTEKEESAIANLNNLSYAEFKEGLKKEIETPEECGSIDNYEEKTTSDEEEHSEKSEELETAADDFLQVQSEESTYKKPMILCLIEGRECELLYKKRTLDGFVVVKYEDGTEEEVPAEDVTLNRIIEA